MDLPLTIAIIVLVLLSGFFSGTETAFSCANKIKLKTLASQGKKNAKAIYKYADAKYDKLVTAILVGNNIVNLTASALGTILFAKLIMNPDVAATVSTAVLTVVVLLFGEITPKYLASVYPEKACFLFYPLMALFYWLLWPLCKIFDGYKYLLAKIFKLKKDETVTDEELLSLVEEAEESGTLKEDESELVRSALEFDDLKVEDILVPRVDVFAVEEDSTMDEVRELFERTGYSRLPVYKDTIDNVIGLIHERDFFSAYVRGEKEISHFVQDIVFTTEYTRISTLLKQLQKQKIHMAAVSDEYGGLLGIVTLEDILEELVGEIWDEDEETVSVATPVSENRWQASGDTHIEDLLELIAPEIELPEEHPTTLSGWIIDLLQRIPEAGEEFTLCGIRICVLSMDEHVIESVELTVPEKVSEE